MNAPFNSLKAPPRSGEARRAKRSQVSSLDYFHLIISIAFAILVDCLISIAPRGKTSEAKSSLVNNGEITTKQSEVKSRQQLCAQRARLHCF